MGQALYEQTLMFADINKIIDEKCQIRIKEYQFCKEFNCPPYPSLSETPATIIDDFNVIQEEMIQFTSKDN